MQKLHLTVIMLDISAETLAGLICEWKFKRVVVLSTQSLPNQSVVDTAVFTEPKGRNMLKWQKITEKTTVSSEVFLIHSEGRS